MAKNKSSDKKNVWKGIQKRLSTGKKPQETDPIKVIASPFGESPSKSSSMVSVEEDFKDAEDEDDDYFQSEEDSEKEELNQAPEGKEEEKEEKSTVRPMSEMAFILPALQNHGYDSDEEVSLPDKEEEEIESLQVRQPKVEEPVELKETIEPRVIEDIKKERPTTFEPIPAEKQAVSASPEADSQHLENVVDRGTGSVKESEEIIHQVVDSETSHTQTAAEPIKAVCDIESSGVEKEKEEAKVEKERRVPEVQVEREKSTPEAKHEPEAQVENTPEVKQGTKVQAESTPESNQVIEAKVESMSDTKEEAVGKVKEETESNRLANILPGVEESLKHISSTSDFKKSLEMQNASALPSPSRGFEYSIEDPIDLDLFRDNVIAIEAVDPKNIPVNDLKPRQQEEADQPIREGMTHLFDNRFMKAKRIFETRSTVDPLYALGLGAMAFIKAIMTFHEFDQKTAMSALATAYTIAKAQIDNTCHKKPFKETVSSYFNSILSSNRNGLPADPPASSMPNLGGGLSDPSTFMPNGVLRAHVVKAECCLLMGILQMTQESVVGYLKCGLNIRRAMVSSGESISEWDKSIRNIWTVIRSLPSNLVLALFI
ncbi:hypothetical protein BY458DRAFT_533419 [Sporodiniella umbellata]|nr:hypothetical protein BY458DRAFT_533419 [Sporodiniella umbellata]